MNQLLACGRRIRNLATYGEGSDDEVEDGICFWAKQHDNSILELGNALGRSWGNVRRFLMGELKGKDIRGRILRGSNKGSRWLLLR